MKLKDQEDVAF